MKHDRDRIRRIACGLVRKHGIVNLSRARVCEITGVPVGSFEYVMGSNFSDFRTSVREEVGRGPPDAPIRVLRACASSRREAILRAAVGLSRRVGYLSVTRGAIAKAAGVSPALVTLRFEGMALLRADIMRYAVRESVLEVIAQGLAFGDPLAKAAPPELQRRAVELALL